MKWMKLVIGLSVLITVSLCFAPVYANDYGTAVIDARDSTRLHLRAEPTADSESKGLYYTGTEVICQSDPNAEWVKVLVGAHSGYMNSAYLQTGTEGQLVQSAQPVGVVISESGANLRYGPTTNDGVVRTLAQGESVNVLGETSGHWYFVENKAWNGYIRSDLLELQTRPLDSGVLTGVWIHSNGASPWRTELMIHADLSFVGSYMDSAMEPKIKYEIKFYGRFSELEKIDELTYRTKIVQLDCIGEPGVQFVDSVMIITNEPAGIEKDAQYILYLPGTAESRLMDAERNWPHESENGVLTNAYLCEESSGRGFSLVQKP